jgi:RNA polymerase sigma-70 factor, ECF subfamily
MSAVASAAATMAAIMPPPTSPPPPPRHPLESTAGLLEQARGGDAAARERLFARVLPLLTAWAHRRLPPHARDLAETDDLVQVAMARALGRLERFEPQREGAFLAYLRQILKNLVHDELRRVRARTRAPLTESYEDPHPSPLERTVSRETLARYEAALEALAPEAREAVMLRIEFHYSYPQIAEALGRSNPDAARMMVGRAMVELARRMRDR